MSVLVCDDDPAVRSVVGDIVRRCGGTVLAEADGVGQILALTERFTPDVMVLDLALGSGSGLEVIRQLHLHEQQPRVLVFTAFDAVVDVDDTFVDIVHKPDFDRLEQLLRDRGGRIVERRSGAQPASPPASTPDDKDNFFRALASAPPEGWVVSVPVQDDPAGLATLIRRLVREHDHVLARGNDVLLLLPAGGASALDALGARIDEIQPGTSDQLTCANIGDDPTAAFLTVRGSTNSEAI